VGFNTLQVYTASTNTWQASPAAGRSRSRSSATRRIEFFQHLNAVTFDAQTDSGSQATKTGTNHNGRRCTIAQI
jgi:hypothetical protein